MLSPPPSPGVTSQLSHSNLSRPNSALGRGGIRDHVPWCIALENQRLRPLSFHFMHALLSTSVNCFISSTLIVLVNVDCFQLVTVQLSIFLPCVSHTCKVDSPALNQAHPVFPSIKPQCAQSCLLDRTGVFSQSFKLLSTVIVFLSLAIVSSCLSVYLFSSFSQYPSL